ncbi:MAG: 5'-methylthioadenosine/S-adenosylhomocysteine nucleosidase, partial [Clostridia bacterium]|nr:5'-methylthioadenosine/S-adenosylhomocysteine nucleosidase [Clostridia bacterium]
MKVFVIAMDKEAEPIISAMSIERKISFCRKKVFLGMLYGESVGVVICGVGKVNAAIGTQIAVDELGAEAIINLGVAGGLNGGVKVGEVYGISHAVQYDFDLSEINQTQIGTLDECKTNYLPLNTCPSYPLKKIGTGDRFNDSKADFNLLTKVLGADIRDMECGAIIQ